MKSNSLFISLLIAWALNLIAAPLFDTATSFHIRTPKTDTLSIEGRLSTVQGGGSLRFTTPQYPGEGEQWPAFDFRPEITDWSGFDRLVVDLVNATATQVKFSAFISDSKTSMREGFQEHFPDLGPFGICRTVIELKNFPKSVSLEDIAIVHFFTQRPENPVKLYVSCLELLRPGEALPEFSTGFRKDLGELGKRSLIVSRDQLLGTYESLVATADSSEKRKGLDEAQERLLLQLAGLEEQLSGDDFTAEAYDAILLEGEKLEMRLRRDDALFDWRKACEAAGCATETMLVGVASGAERLFPRDMPVRPQSAVGYALTAARNEYENFQVAVLCQKGLLKNVRVSVGDLLAENGAQIPSGGVSAQVVGFVETKWRPENAPEYVGWYPDPILNFQRSCDVAEGDLQSFWVRIYVPRFQQTGEYRGVVTVSADGQEPVEFPLAVTVHSFTLPDQSALPTAISFATPPPFWGKDALWESRKFQYADFLADYKMDYDSLYRQTGPDWEVVEHLHRQGRLVAFNLGNVFNGGIAEENFEEQMAKTIGRLKPAYEEAKARGLLEYAYIYGFDEQSEKQFGVLERCAKTLKAAFPEVLTMTTSYDHSFGVDTAVKSIDAWCPLTPKYDLAQVEKARGQGRFVWWYICCHPNPPYANWFVESPAIESRLIQGAMSAKFQPDGFLYYALTIWKENQGISQGPFTNWNPVSYRNWHGDGSLFYCDAELRPLPSIRLENYRDGMEDYAYAAILDEAIALVEALSEPSSAQKLWLEKARVAREVPATLVLDMAEYSHEPRALAAWREGMAQAIETSGLAPQLNPWHNPARPYGVRGFRGLNNND